MRKLFVISLFVTLLITSLTAFASPINNFKKILHTRSVDSDLNLNGRSISNLIINFSDDFMDKRSYQSLETRMGKSSKKGGKTSTDTINGYDSFDWHKNIKPKINSYFGKHDPKSGMNGNNPDYEIKKGQVKAKPTATGKKGSGFSAEMDKVLHPDQPGPDEDIPVKRRSATF